MPRCWKPRRTKRHIPRRPILPETCHAPGMSVWVTFRENRQRLFPGNQALPEVPGHPHIGTVVTTYSRIPFIPTSFHSSLSVSLSVFTSLPSSAISNSFGPGGDLSIGLNSTTCHFYKRDFHISQSLTNGGQLLRSN